MDLFDNTPDRPQPNTEDLEFSKWSYSRRNKLERCARAYYFEYYGSRANTAEAEPLTEDLRKLKKLSSRHLLAGSILHLVIRKSLEDRRQGQKWTQQRMQEWARSLFEESIELSRSYQEGDPVPNGYSGPSLLLEYYYDLDKAESLCQKAKERLMTALKNFAKKPAIDRLKAGACQDGALIEKRMRHKVSGVTIDGTIDLGYPDWENGNRRIKIVDWKLGGARNGDDSLQLLAYGLAAADHFNCDLEVLDLIRVRLTNGEVDSYSMTSEKALRARCRVLQDVERMRMLHEHGRKAEKNAFPQCGHSRVCSLCKFQKYCPE